jgi:hypothetical protein
MSYQNPDYKLVKGTPEFKNKLEVLKAEKIIKSLKRKNAGRAQKEKEAVAGIVSKRKSEIDKKVLEIDAKKLEELEKKLKTKAKVHPKPEPPPPPPKSLVIENTQEAIKAPPPFKEVPGGRGRGRGRGGIRAPARQLTYEEIEENKRKMKDYDKQLFGYDERTMKVGFPVGYLGRSMALTASSPFSEGQAFAKYKARIASGQPGFSDSDDD